MLDRLESELRALAPGIGDLAASVGTSYFDPQGRGIVFVGFPSYSYNDPDAKTKGVQTTLLRDWHEWSDGYKFLIESLPPDVKREAREALSRTEKWIHLDRNYSLTGDPKVNRDSALNDAMGLLRPLDVLRHAYRPITTLVPDTNSLIATPDPQDYVGIAGEVFEFVLLPTVLGELDELKVVRRSDDFRKKVEGVINRLKEMRRRGDVVEGVTAAKKIILRFIAREPKFDKTLNWLDPLNKDDRIIASALELQRENPAAVVVLVTGDINLQNKATAARLPVAELP